MRSLNPLDLKPVLVEARGAAWSPGAPPPFCPTGSGRPPPWRTSPLSARLPPLSARGATTGGNFGRDVGKIPVRALSEGARPSKQPRTVGDSRCLQTSVENRHVTRQGTLESELESTLSLDSAEKTFPTEQFVRGILQQQTLPKAKEICADHCDSSVRDQESIYGSFEDLHAEVLALVQHIRSEGERLAKIEQHCRAKAKQASQMQRVLKVAKGQPRQRSASPVGSQTSPSPAEKKIPEYKPHLSETAPLLDDLRQRLASRKDANEHLRKQIAAIRIGDEAAFLDLQESADDMRSVMSAEDVDAPVSRADIEDGDFDPDLDMMVRVTF